MKLPCAALIMAVALLSGCTVPSAGKMATTTVTFVGSVATKTTVAAVKTSSQVAVSTTKAVVHTSGSIARTAITTPFIVFKDTATGITKQIPFSEGLRLYAASETAKLQMGIEAFQLLRNGTPVMKSVWTKVKAGTPTDPVLHSGDVIQISRAIKRSKST